MSTETAEQPAPEPEPAFDPWKPYIPSEETPQPPPAAPAVRPRRRRRTVLLLSSALLLGVLGGGGVGYAIQAKRPPTPLPPIDVAQPAYPTRPLDAKAAAAAAPKPLEIDGDLRKLLVKKPKGAKPWDFLAGEDGWMSAGDMALLWGNSATIFKELLHDDFRRAAETTWTEGRTDVRIRLIQYGPGNAGEPISVVQGTSYCSGSNDDPCTEHYLPGTDDGVAYVTDSSEAYIDDDERYYYGLAVARRGDVLMRIEFHSPTKVKLSRVIDLAEQQWEKL